jgi:hypothetical protein
MDSNPITYFAETDARNKKIRFGIKESDRLRHVYVVGKTGVGKSTMLENMAIQDIQNGNGIAFIDPHGSTAEKLLDYVPENRIKDVLYFAPFDLEHPVSFNVLEDIGADKRHLVVNGLMSTFEKIWEDAWSARMSYILINTLLALLEYPGATLLGVNRMLSDKEYRKKVVENVKDPSVKSFWIEEFGKYTEKYAADATPAIQNKVGQFTSNPLVRNLVGQAKSSFDIRDFMDNKKILIINLSKGLVGEGNANLIGSMLITKMYLAAMSRADKTKADLAGLPNFYLYVDEFQSFANKSFADILSESRKYKLGLNITHQYIEQMEEEVRDAVFGNVGTMVTFRVGAFDAEVLEKEFAPTFTAEDLVNLGKYQIYLKLMIDEVSSHPFSAVTMPMIVRPDKSFKQEVIENSWKQFTRPRAEVEEEIRKWHEEGTGRSSADVAVPLRASPRDRIPYSEPRRDMNHEIGARSGVVEFARKNVTEEKKDVLQSNGNFRQRDARPQASGNVGIVAPDPNKVAFMKAAEDLREKSSIVEKVADGSLQSTRNFGTGTTASLSTLNERDNKKNPTTENVSSLKNALSQVMKKTDVPLPKLHGLGQQVPKDATSAKDELKTPATSASGREIPEQTLREVLSMEETK